MKTILSITLTFLFFLVNCSTKSSGNSGVAALALVGSGSSSNSSYIPKGDVIDMSKAFNSTLTNNMVIKSNKDGIRAFSVQGNAKNTWFKVPNGKLDVPFGSTLTFALNAKSDSDFSKDTGIITIGTYEANKEDSGKKSNFDGTTNKFDLKSIKKKKDSDKDFTAEGIMALAFAIDKARKNNNNAAALNAIAGAANTIAVKTTVGDAISAIPDSIKNSLGLDQGNITAAAKAANSGKKRDETSITLNCTPATTAICYVKSITMDRTTNQTKTTEQDRKMFTANNSCQQLFTPTSGVTTASSYIKVEAQANTVVTFESLAGEMVSGFGGSKFATPSISVFKNFTGCSDQNNRFNTSTRSNPNNAASETGDSPDYTQTGTKSVNARKITFKQAGTYLLQIYDPGQGHKSDSATNGRTPLPFRKTSSNNYPTVKITN